MRSRGHKGRRRQENKDEKKEDKQQTEQYEQTPPVCSLSLTHWQRLQDTNISTRHIHGIHTNVGHTYTYVSDLINFFKSAASDSIIQ